MRMKCSTELFLGNTVRVVGEEGREALWSQSGERGVIKVGYFLSPRLRVNRGAYRFRRYKNPSRPYPSASRDLGERSPISPMLSYPHPPSPTAVRSTNRLRLRRSISSP